ncbi:MAG: hypothetical protein AUK44_04475 [Porphyromonadaceae bacterium CG2_30_38_12]|nr:MAG: hypothetical protein AUK44_04475 [Porphyromonadaceae bacterium CG2_30_38_12]
MKTYNNHINRLLIIALVALSIAINSCSDSFLEVDAKATQIENNYYKNADEIWNGVVAAYDPISWEGGTAHTNYCSITSLIAASDEANGGGGSASDVWYLQTMNNFTLLDPANGPQGAYWEKLYAGVYRSCLMLSILNNTNVNDLSNELKYRYLAELHFLRAYYYFDLVRLFGKIIFYTEPLTPDKMYQQTQVAPSIVYEQIEKDLIAAINESNLPDKVPAATEGGRVTKGMAHALLGKVYLYQKKWSQAAEQLAIVNAEPEQSNRFGYKLLDNFSQIFRPDNQFNSESILEISHASVGSQWSQQYKIEGNMVAMMVSPRSYNGPLYDSGWGGCPIRTEFYNDMKNDPRLDATIIDMNKLATEHGATYSQSYDNTGYFVKKFAALKEFANKGAGPRALNYPQNYIEIRLADTYLMEAEAILESTNGDANRALTLLSAVRARVGLAPVAATLENVYNERKLELATEGHRWYDLVRTGQAPTILGRNGFVAGKNEVLPIPLEEMTNTKLEQNNY